MNLTLKLFDDHWLIDKTSKKKKDLYTLGHKYGILTFSESKIHLLRFACQNFESECQNSLRNFLYFTSRYKSVRFKIFVRLFYEFWTTEATNATNHCLPFRSTWTHPGFYRIRVTPALVFSVVLCVLCLSFVSFCWPWSCLSSDLTIYVCPFGIFEFLFLKPTYLWTNTDFVFRIESFQMIFFYQGFIM